MKRTVSILLCAVMLFLELPLGVFALDENGSDGELQTGESTLPQYNSAITPAEDTELISLQNKLEYEVWDGSINTELEGAGTEEDPYLIKNGADLMGFAQNVNDNWINYEGKHIRLENNIDMGMLDGTNDAVWTPVGYTENRAFKGHFDGAGHEITNLSMQAGCQEISEASRLYEADSVEQYVGFFGVVIGAEIKNLVITNYKIDQKYNYDTTAGAIAGRVDSSTVTNCSALGEIKAAFIDINPLDRADVRTYSHLVDRFDIENEHGQGVEIYLTENIADINRTVTFGGDISAVRLIGDPDSDACASLNIVIEGHEKFAFYLDLSAISIQGTTAGTPTITCTSGRDIYIYSGGGMNEIFAADGTNAIYAPNSRITILGDSTFYIVGGNGADGADGADATSAGADGKAGTDGTNGKEAVVCDSMRIAYNEGSSVYIVGGDGGNGGDGGDGKRGKNGDRKDVWYSTAPNGQDGGDGGKGGNGGMGGQSVVLAEGKNVEVMSGTAVLWTGITGDGGDGGIGGDGGTGGYTNSWYSKGGNGGAGGYGGAGGDAYSKGFVLDHDLVIAYGRSRVVVSERGWEGEVGSGGRGGYGGAAGKNDGGSLCPGKENGSPGTDRSGTYGATGTRITDNYFYIMGEIEGNLNYKTIYVENLNNAAFTYGNFIGESNNSVIKKGASVAAAADITFKYVYLTVSPAMFIYEANNTVITDYVCAKMSDNKLELHDEGLHFVDTAGSDISPLEVVFLSTYTGTEQAVLYVDDSGFVYDCGVRTDNTLSSERTVYKYTGTGTDVSVPSYAFDGRFITEVTSIYRGAFASNETLVNVHLGNLVRETGASILSGCPALETVSIGANLVDAYEIDLQNPSKSKVPFGMDKDSLSRLKEYQVDPANTVFASEDGILYERFNINVDNEQVADYVNIAIIDVPVNVPITDLAPSAHVLRIFPGAFEHNRTLRTVTLDSVQDVGDYAFRNALGLRSVTIGGTDDDYIGEVEILGKKYEAGREVFSQKIGINAFSGCTNLSSVDLSSDDITMIGAGAFSGCATAQSASPMTIVIGKYVTTIAASHDQLVNGESNSTEQDGVVNFHATFAGANVASFTVIDGNECYRTIGGVLYLRTGRTVGELEELWLLAYPNCAPDGDFAVCAGDGYTVTRIKQSAFEGARNVGILDIGDCVTGIDNYAFRSAGMHTLNIGEHVSILGSTVSGSEEMFLGCTELKRINVHEDNAYFTSVAGVLYDKALTTLIKYPQQKEGYEFAAPESVREIANYAFDGNMLIRRVSFLCGVARVGTHAFRNCQNISIVYFREGTAPFDSAAAVELGGAFETANPRTVICYGADDASWEKLSGDYYNKHGEKIFSIDRFTGYPEDKVGTGYYAFVVVDATGAPISDIYVSLDNGTLVSKQTTDGIATFLDLEYGVPYKLRLIDNNGEFYPIENDEFYLDEATRVTYITLSTVPTVSGVNVKYNNSAKDKVSADDVVAGGLLGLVEVIGGTERSVDINSQTAQINRWSVDKLNITVNCGLDDDFKVLGYYLLQGDREVKRFSSEDDLLALCAIDTGSVYSGKTIYALTLGIDTDALADGEDIYFVLEFENNAGERQDVRTKLNIEMLTLDLYPIKADWATSGIKFTVDESLPFIGGAELEIGSKNYKPKVSVGVGDDYFRIIIGNIDKDFEFGDNYEETNSLKNWNTYRDAIKSGKIKDTTLFEDEYNNKVGLALDGYVEFKHKGTDANGNADIATTVSLKGTVKYTLSAGSTMQVLFFPVRVDVELSVQGEATLKLVFDKEASQFCTPDFSFKFTGGISAFAGVGCKVASAGIYGEIKMVIVLDIYASSGQTGDEDDHWFNLNEWKLSGDMGFYVKYDGLFVRFKKTWSIIKAVGLSGEWVIYGNGQWFPEDYSTLAYSVSQTELYNSANYEIAESTEQDGLDIVGITSLSGIEDAYSSIAPRLIDTESAIYIVYQQNLDGYADYDSYNYQKLVYQIYDKESGSFSEVYILDDNGYADGAFEVWTDGENAAILYTQLNRRLKTGNEEDISDYVAALEIKTAYLTDGRFAVGTALTEDTYYDMSPTLGVIDGKLTALWVRCENNNMLGAASETALSSVWYSQYTDGEWSEEALLVGELNTVSELELCGDMVFVVTDVDNDLLSGDDRCVSLYMLNGATSSLPSEGAYHGISNIDGTPVYYGNNTLCDFGGASILREGVTIPEGYRILGAADGSVRAILYVDNTEYGEDLVGSNVYAIFRDDGAFGYPVALTDLGADVFVSAFDAVDTGEGVMLSILTTSYEYVGGGEYEQYSTVNAFDVYHVDYPSGYTLGEISYMPEGFSLDADITASIKVTNESIASLGELPVTAERGVESFAVSIDGYYDADGNLIGDTLPSGMTGYLRIRFAAGNASSTPYTVGIDGTKYEIDAWKSDLALFGKHVIIGGQHKVIVNVTNLGYLDSAPTTLCVSVSGETYNIGSLARGEGQHFTIPIASSAADESILVTLTLDADGEHVTANNTAMVLTSPSGDRYHELGTLGVWLSAPDRVIDRDSIADVVFEYDTYYTVASVTVNGIVYSPSSGAYTVADGSIVLSGAFFASALADGTYPVTVTFSDGASGEYTTATDLRVTRYYDVAFDVDGEVTVYRAEQGTLPEIPSRTGKSADAEFTYTFAGWDADGDGEADGVSEANADTAYVAVYTRERNSYTVTWMVDGERYREVYEYGELPVFTGSTEKYSDTRGYDFTGWSREITAVEGNVTYVAEYSAYRFGDYDRDGALSNIDLTLLVRYLSGFEADGVHSLNGDERINNRDAILLIQKLSEWE